MTRGWRPSVRAGAIVFLSQSIAMVPSCVTMMRLGFGPPISLFQSLITAAIASFWIAMVAFSFLGSDGSKARLACVLLGAGCSLVSFPVAYSLKAIYDVYNVGGDSAGTWFGSFLAILILAIGGVAIATLCIPYLCGAMAGYVIWKLRLWRR